MSAQKRSPDKSVATHAMVEGHRDLQMKINQDPLPSCGGGGILPPLKPRVMITAKQKYAHKKSPLLMKVLNKSISHDKHWHVGLMLDGHIVLTCHIHYKDISEDWDLQP